MLFKFLLCLFSMCLWVSACLSVTTFRWRSEDRLWELFLLPEVGTEDMTQIVIKTLLLIPINKHPLLTYLKACSGLIWYYKWLVSNLWSHNVSQIKASVSKDTIYILFLYRWETSINMYWMNKVKGISWSR